MLRKMLKYDIQAMSKTFIPFFIAILVISIFSALSMHLEWLIGIFGGATILFGLGIALFVTSLVLIITQFYKNVLGDQGYHHPFQTFFCYFLVDLKRHCCHPRLSDYLNGIDG